MFSFENRKTRVKVLCQAVIGGCMLFCVFQAIQRLPIGDFSAIAFSSPVFTMILSSFVLRERCGLFRVTVGILLIGGVVVLTRPSMIFGTQMTPLNENFTTAEHSMTEDEKQVVSSLDENLQKSDIIGICFAVLTAILSATISILAR